MGATYGRNLRLTIFGESHGKGIGLVLDGIPAGRGSMKLLLKKKWPAERRVPAYSVRSEKKRMPIRLKAVCLRAGRQEPLCAP